MVLAEALPAVADRLILRRDYYSLTAPLHAQSAQQGKSAVDPVRDLDFKYKHIEAFMENYVVPGGETIRPKQMPIPTTRRSVG